MAELTPTANVEEVTDTSQEDHVYRDELPEDLDITRAQAAYQLPDMLRRRNYAIVAWGLGLALLALWVWRGNGVFVNVGFGVLGVCLLVAGTVMWFMGWPLRIREVEAIERGSAAVHFPIGHIAAQLGWQGIRARPTWRILLYSAENPPAQRAVVLIDGVDGAVKFADTEANPEQWNERELAANR